MSNSLRALLVWLLVAVCAALTFLSFDFNAHRRQVYTADLGVAPGSGPVSVVFYAGRWSTYRADGSLTGDLADWQVQEQRDSTMVTSRNDQAALHLRTFGTPLNVSLLRIGGAGTAVLTDAQGRQRAFALAADSESIESFTVGGTDSAVPAVPGPPLAPRVYYGLLALIGAGFAALALFQLHSARGRRPAPPSGGLRETLGFAAPLVLTPIFVQLAYWPASTAFDGGLQWSEAAQPGHLTEAIVIPVTLLFRQFARLSPNPAWLLLAQIALAAVGTALMLRELRWRGVPRWAAQGAALLIALTPQYPTFFAVIAKDAWNAVGLLYTAYFALAFLRQRAAGATAMTTLALMAGAAVFAGLMRPNTLAPIGLFMLVMTLWLRPRLGGAAAAALFAAYLTAALSMPGIVTRGSIEALDAGAAGSAAMESEPPAARLPLGVFANIYIFHLFAALQHAGVPMATEDSALFYAIAPASAWADYDCAVHDRTQFAVAQAALMEPTVLRQYVAEHQIAMGRAVAQALLRHPAVLFERQACVSGLVWSISYGTAPFQVNATLGYDDPPPAFIALAGDNRSLLGEWARQWIRGYVAWSEAWNHRWLFWRPLLYTVLGVFAVLLFSLAHRRGDALLVGFLPLALTLSLILLIPFPAFRYQYPATLLFMLMALLVLARPPRPADGRDAH